jgi:hypothetical protein
LHPQRQRAVHFWVPFGADDEWVPLRIGGEVGEDLPHLLGGGIDLDLVRTMRPTDRSRYQAQHQHRESGDYAEDVAPQLEASR